MSGRPRRRGVEGRGGRERPRGEGGMGGPPAGEIDPITFEVIQHGLGALVDEMALTIMRTA